MPSTPQRTFRYPDSRWKIFQSVCEAFEVSASDAISAYVDACSQSKTLISPIESSNAEAIRDTLQDQIDRLQDQVGELSGELAIAKHGQAQVENEEYSTTLRELFRSNGKDKKSLGDSHMPYCLHRIEGDRWIVLNRNYSPLGANAKTRDGRINYDDYSVQLKITQKRAEAMSWKPVTLTNEPGEGVWLYNDGCNPFRSGATTAHMESYCEKLSILIKLQYK